jgi:alanyl-tRNA synthetase
MKKLSYVEIREKYLQFFAKNNHAIIPSSSLIPENDPSTLFVNSGMFPLIPFLLGEKHPAGNRLANSQRCVRTIDIEEVGDDSHCTTFEMLGNWSLNDYFKKEAINLTVEFFVDELGLDINRIYASVFEGDKDAPRDTQSIEIWTELFEKRGIQAKVGKGEKIQAYGKSENWWELPGGGPCGPCTEIFYDTEKESCCDDCCISCSCGKYLEIGNNVLMEYLKDGNSYKPLGRHNVDFGGGLDRLALILQEKDNVFETDIYKPILEKVKSLSKKDNITSQRIVVDHIKAATWVIMDGITPGRTEREYILRRLIRRAIRHAKALEIEDGFTAQVGIVAIEQFSQIWEDLEKKREKILATLTAEEDKFNKTLKDGLKEVKKITQNTKDTFKNEDGISFKVYETYGFPPEMLIEELKSENIEIDDDAFWKNHNEAFKEHQEKSRTAGKGFFKGGLADTSDKSVKLHTTTHLLLKALRDVLGPEVYQKGSNITPERLRFDFPSEEKLSPEQIQKVEEIVNDVINAGLDITFEEKTKEEAMKIVSNASFEERYDNILKVYYIGDKENPYSVEICNGPHVKNTSELGKFKITKQENVGAGIKRIKAVLE